MKWNRLWLMVLALLTALVLIVWGRDYPLTEQPTAGVIGQELAAQAQTPNPAPQTPAAAQQTPQASPTPTAPAPAAAPTPGPPSVPAIPVSGTYKDPAGLFQVGILNGYKVTSLGRNPLIEAPGGNLAYTAIVRPRATTQPLPETALAQIAIDTFAGGEGFQAGAFQVSAPGTVRIPWTGRLTLGRTTQPMRGVILSRQSEGNVLILLVAATEAGSNQLDGAIAALGDTLKPLPTGT